MSDINVKDDIKGVFADLMSHSRIPHAVLIDGGTEDDRTSAAEYLARWAVCSGDNSPCGVCSDCIKSLASSHPDIIIPKSSGKTSIVNMETMRSIIADANIVTNEANTKVFLLYEADKRMKEDVQNAFLKILEEPPLSTLFILTCSNSKRMLGTILSRVQVFSLNTNDSICEQTQQLSQEIISGILSSKEVDLLYATAKLNDRDTLRQVLPVVSEYLRLGLSKSVGADIHDKTADSIAKKFTKTRIIALIDATSKAIIKADRNVNLTILCTWLCGEYRRISWQR